jgi:branched-chain amino acid transport system permease protein
LPQLLTNPYGLQVFILMFIYAGAAGAWNIVGGYAGQISLGHVAFFGIGAYTSTLLYTRFAVTPWVGMLAGGVLAGVVAGLISWPCFRLRGPFFTLATLAFSEVLRLLSIWARPVTGGSVGVTILFKPGIGSMQFYGKAPWYYLSLGLMILIVAISALIARSKFGSCLTALKEDHDAAEALGVHTALYKLYAIVISGFLTAMCGTVYAQLMLYVEPSSVFHSTLSIQFAMLAVVGGSGTVWGPVLGSIIITPLNELLRGWLGGSLQGFNFVILGVVIILVVTFMPNGLFGAIETGARKLGKIRKIPPRGEMFTAPGISDVKRRGA